jgi:hypothetical protein
MSQTERNPSIIAFFIALANENGTKAVDMEEFEELWKTRIMNKHERFQCRVPESKTHCFEVSELLLPLNMLRCALSPLNRRYVECPL